MSSQKEDSNRKQMYWKSETRVDTTVVYTKT